MICAVIGSPISHSLSPALHAAAYAWLGLDWTYERHEVTAEGVPAFLASLPDGWRGLSATMPCKTAIVSCGQPDSIVESLGVGNTLIFDGRASDSTTTRVANTDVLGIRTVLDALALTTSDIVEVWGNGATARSAIYALAGAGADVVHVVARDAEKTARLRRDASQWGIDVISNPHRVDQALRPTLIISTLPADIAERHIRVAQEARAVFDVLYKPWPTPLIHAATQGGLQVATGLDLLAAQAVGQVRLMTGKDIPLAVLREAAHQAMLAQGQ